MNPGPFKSSVIGVFALALMLSACSSRPPMPTPAEQKEKIEKLIADGGFVPERNYKIDSLRERWQHNGESIDVVLSAPDNSGIYPLILYFPGLGETAESGKLWRETWAKAGYAVFSMQPIAMAQAIKPDQPQSGRLESGKSQQDQDKDNNDDSAEKRNVNKDLHYLGHRYFAKEMLQKRIKQVQWAYSQMLERGYNGGGRLYRRIDSSILLVAGYELGAQTAAALIGENYGIAGTVAFKPRGAILLSPFVDIATGDINTRFRNMETPFLAITGPGDSDPYGIGSAHVRTAVWEYAAPGSKYLLLLNQADHRLLAGSALSGQAEEGGHGSSGKHSGHQHGKHGDGSDSPLRFGGGGGEHGRRPENGGTESGPGDGGGFVAKKESYQAIADMYSVSTAFLEWVSKSDRFARVWLQDFAQEWLGKSATLKIK